MGMSESRWKELRWRWRETHLWCLRLDFAGTGEGAVNFTHDCGWIVGSGCAFDEGRCADEEV